MQHPHAPSLLATKQERDAVCTTLSPKQRDFDKMQTANDQAPQHPNTSTHANQPIVPQRSNPVKASSSYPDTLPPPPPPPTPNAGVPTGGGGGGG